MSRKLIILLFGVAAVGAFAVSYVVMQHQHKVASATTRVALRANGASPDAITVVAGKFVEFDSKDQKSHNLIEGTPTGSHEHTAGDLTSGVFQADEGWRVQFKNPGTYNFYDQLNPRITVTVVAYVPKK